MMRGICCRVGHGNTVGRGFRGARQVALTSKPRQRRETFISTRFGNGEPITGTAAGNLGVMATYWILLLKLRGRMGRRNLCAKTNRVSEGSVSDPLGWIEGQSQQSKIQESLGFWV